MAHENSDEALISTDFEQKIDSRFDLNTNNIDHHLILQNTDEST